MYNKLVMPGTGKGWQRWENMGDGEWEVQPSRYRIGDIVNGIKIDSYDDR